VTSGDHDGHPDGHPDGARIHRAANDPAFAARREAAFVAVQSAIAAVVEPAGFVARGQGWARETGTGRATVWLQRDRYGWEVSVILRWLAGDHGDEVTLRRVVYDDVNAELLAVVAGQIAGDGLAWFAARG
jgi:hypothetical protein